MGQITDSIMTIMTDTLIFTIVSSLLGVLFGVLLLLLAWIGNRVHTRLDEISKSLGAIERDLRNDLISLDRRVTRTESHLSLDKA
jgi:hypothetical protein